MRKITNEARLAFLSYEDYKKSNTQVEVMRQPHMTDVTMYLHGNLIARKTKEELRLYTGGWETLTTKERLNGVLHGIGLKIKQVNYEWIIMNHNQSWKFDEVDYIDLNTNMPVTYPF